MRSRRASYARRALLTATLLKQCACAPSCLRVMSGERVCARNVRMGRLALPRCPMLSCTHALKRRRESAERERWGDALDT